MKQKVLIGVKVVCDPPLLKAAKLAYRKHCMGDDRVGWEDVDSALLDALCEVLGDRGFERWRKTVGE
jgi:hypothetical protein